jgi:hypothetical protein
VSPQPDLLQSGAAGREGPIEPGSLLHRMLQLIALRIARAEGAKSSSSDNGGEGRISPCLPPTSSEGLAQKSCL